MSSSDSPTCAIYTVHVFQRQPEGGYRLRVHLVAASNSAAAEQRLKETQACHLQGECFIATDDYIKSQAHPYVSLYASEYRNEPVTANEYKRWVSTMTEVFVEDGQIHPASFRPFSL